MKKSRIKIVASVFVAALLITSGSVFGQANGTTEVKAATVTSTTAAAATATASRLSFEQLKQKALAIVPGTITNYKYGYDNGTQILEIEIRDNNGRKREIDLVAATGQVWKIDHEIDATGNMFINQSLFTVNKSFEECRTIALTQVPGGTVLTSKQDSENGRFVYDFEIKSTDGKVYEVDVETSSGLVVRVDAKNDVYNYGEVSTQPVGQDQVSTQPVTQVVANTGMNSAKNVVRRRFPGCTFLTARQDWDDGRLQYRFRVKATDGTVYDVRVSGNYITEIDAEGKYVNGVYYDY
ncbi:PepSY domain-containing protein [Candidatus Arthromitus sp. SFB-rat-Yit]|uniref:PepSY domain-containing protein n=1 Tax=Candidatus Arthromitus sp. SFB-rat-Yit TaxID=1041504 RepID=UPI000227A481|nr:PepSY domain-containing protein [Candidatus Arthromitus sp. SFB-rat-Yit]BAK81541.1 putative peptidase [Candidatus Arthromitus sp. SFB-rat-Yit]